MRRFGYWLAGSALILPIWTAGAQETAQGPAPEAFRNPPADSRPGTFYHWMNGNVTEAGLDADLTSMRDGESITLPTYAAVTARSYHPGGVNALLLDGSVRFMKSSIALPVWRALGTRSGSEVISSDAF